MTQADLKISGNVSESNDLCIRCAKGSEITWFADFNNSTFISSTPAEFISFRLKISLLTSAE